MNVDIKERTAMIKNRVIPDSHKKTKNMIIPLEWEEKPIKDICKINKKSLGTSTEDTYQFRYYDLSAIDNGKVYHPFEKITFETAPSRARRVFQKYDILLSTVRPNLKGFAYIDFDVNDCIASTGFAVLESHDQNDAQYIYQNLYSCGIEKQINRLLVGSNYPAINNDEVENLRIPYPENRYERKEIGDILSTWDKAIELKEKLIEEKKKQKSCLMQKLLTGKVRLPGFDGEWALITLGDYLIKHTEKTTENNQYPVLTSSRNGIFFQKDYFDGNDVASKDNTGYNVVPRDFFTYRHMSDDLIFKFNINTIVDKGIVSTLYPVFTTKKELDSNFLKLVLNEGIEFKQHALSQKQGGSRTYMYYSKLEELEIKIPSIEEQVAISELEKLANREIELLEKELEALKQQKKGLMQLLLTGIIRVKVETN